MVMICGARGSGLLEGLPHLACHRGILISESGKLKVDSLVGKYSGFWWILCRFEMPADS